MATENKQMVNLKINGIPVSVPAGSTILQAAKAVNVEIPSLCYLKDVNCIGACRVCVVEIVGRRGSPRNPSKYDLKYYMFLALLNIKKANSIINGNWRKPSYSIYTSEITQEAIVAAEGNAAIAENNVYVLNSLPLLPCRRNCLF